MRSLLAGMLAAVAIAGGAVSPAEASAGASLRGGAVDQAGRHGHAADEARLQLARTSFDDDGDARPARRWRGDGRRGDRQWQRRWDGEWERPRRVKRHARSARRWSRGSKQARRAALKQRRAARRSVHRTARVAVRNNRRGASWSAPVRSDSTGVASYYWQGQRTATGERYNPDGMTAAHRTLPFGTRVRVTHLGNGRTVDVRINDRGPFIGGRIIDLSRGAAGVLGMRQQGLARVKVTVLGR